MRAITAEVVIDTVRWIAAGHAPFQVHSVGEVWMITGRDGDNCIAHPKDGLRAIFPDEQPAILLCQELNRRAGR